MTRRSRSLGILFALLLMFAAAKTQIDIDLGPSARDADYYFTIARSIALGEGFRSNLSLYYQGFKEFPHLVTTSPLWPAVLGGTAKLFGLGNLTTSLPAAFYLLDLVLVYFLALRLRERMAEPASGTFFREGRVPDIGHVAVLILGSNVVFFRFTSVPNNEAIAFCFAIGALLALDRAVTDRSSGCAGAAGMLGAAALLTRVQTLGLALAVLSRHGSNRADSRDDRQGAAPENPVTLRRSCYPRIPGAHSHGRPLSQEPRRCNLCT